MPELQSRDVPGGVKPVALLVALVGAAQLLGGIVLVALSDRASGYSATAAVVYGVVLIVAGTIYVVVARRLPRLDPIAFAAGLLLSGLRAIFDAIWLVLLGADGVGIANLVALVVNAAVFLALWSRRAAFDRDD